MITIHKRQKLNRREKQILVIVCVILAVIIPVTISSITVNDSQRPSNQITQSVPKQYKTALSVAKNYSNVMHMSKQDISTQLSSGNNGKFSQKAITYALKNINANYNNNALNKAKEYSDSQNMSKQAIHDDLISKNKFTSDQAQYAVDNLKADYNQNALITAKAYQRDLNFSPATIRQVLISDQNEKFTPEQADYAIQHLND